MIFDVLPPLQYRASEAYRESWDEWQPDTQGAVLFDLHDLQISHGTDLAFAHCLIHCGGTLADGNSFEDWVRATFCLRKGKSGWQIVHQHISKPFAQRGE